MQTIETKAILPEWRESQKAALINLLGDEDEAVYDAVRDKIISAGPTARTWLRPFFLSGDPLVRRRSMEITRHFDRQSADDTFLAFCLQHGEDLDLEQGAWRLAQTQYPDINVEAYTALLDQFAAELSTRIEPHHRATPLLNAMNEFVFGQLAFAGNEANYYDPDNSYLNRVLDRRTGNPIALSLVYLLLARRLRLPVTGIGLPGHFLCRYQSASDEIFIDAFNKGKLLTKSDCIHYLARGNFDVRDAYLAPISSRRLLARVCGNLHQIYVRLGHAESVTRFQRYLVALAR
jgi:regulator of sirC expression with transglutaminase-like and TPR domain